MESRMRKSCPKEAYLNLSRYRFNWISRAFRGHYVPLTTAPKASDAEKCQRAIGQGSTSIKNLAHQSLRLNAQATPAPAIPAAASITEAGAAGVLGSA